VLLLLLLVELANESFELDLKLSTRETREDLCLRWGIGEGGVELSLVCSCDRLVLNGVVGLLMISSLLSSLGVSGSCCCCCCCCSVVVVVEIMLVGLNRLLNEIFR